MKINEILKKEFNLRDEQIKNTIKLIDEGNTIPFIARYRKEMTGEMSDVVLRAFHDKLVYLRNLESRKEDVIRIIEEQGKLTEELQKNIAKANTLQEVEDIYAPFKQKKRTRATIAKEKGLENFALAILNGEVEDISIEAKKYINTEKDVNSEDDAIKGAKDIIAEVVSEDAKIRKYIRELALREGMISTKNSKDEKSVYDMYYDYNEAVKTMAPHRVLAVNRGEKEGFLKVKLEINNDKVINHIVSEYVKEKNKSKEEIISSIEDAYKRLIFPSIEREIRNQLTENAQERAISVFGKNIKSLLLQPPVKDKVVMGFDPAFRTGCKIAVVDKNGKLLDFTTVYPTQPQNKVEEAKKELKELIRKYSIDIISIGNGTASRESEKIVSDMIKEMDEEVQYIIVNEAGASVYSASELANEEHPDINVSIRGAISIARRLQDPLAELVKIDPKSIGVGQYQHDLNQKRLEQVLGGVVEDSVNSVGVDLNTASYSLLEHIAGISHSIAKNIVAYREENGDFTSRAQLKKVKRLGPQAFTQCAGFMRISDAKNPLDNTGVHPESYKTCESMLKLLGYSMDDLKNRNIEDIDSKVEQIGLKKLSEELEVGELTLKDIISEIKKPGRDPREEGIKPILRTDVLKIEDIQEGMVLKGTVRNVVDFGAFVDIGIKNDGLVHKSQMSKSFVKDPMDIVTVGDIIDVKVIGVDIDKQRVALSMNI
ncbi:MULTISPECIES: Tex family protein [Romboutsia]|uniref:Tex family protein n=1 Tax=Romboutsia TaxID=1501226 RepID=UPI001F054575|nr:MULTISPECIES: Tex family protein [Romboutsia]MCH1958994.1 RNA-binding transcriptional accessory protein [Romboutsia hominis]MDB8805908.1 Tex family protein [Romboutsia sp. 1001216sp1]MDB8808359.1 Tex family protein [Romboutsia sp. 1001216sp1]MDB8811661.1 Tex family protein [Romboutsia sp. 1001216sp1]MDB8817348.1 Tex family protein [Romboutsia sp. 1001216sp1]